MDKTDSVRIGVFTMKQENAKKYFDWLNATHKGEVAKYVVSTTYISLTLKDGTNYIYVNPSFSPRGYRLTKAVIDFV